jgi:hypothetical protein
MGRVRNLRLVPLQLEILFRLLMGAIEILCTASTSPASFEPSAQTAGRQVRIAEQYSGND